MSAVYLMEKFKFEDALDHLLEAKVIFEQIKSYQDAVEALIYEEKVNQLETFIRQCALRLQISDSDKIRFSDADAITTKIQLAYKNQQVNDDAGQVEDGANAAEYAGKRMCKEILIGQRKVPIRSLKLQEAFGRYSDKNEQIASF